MPNTNDDMRNWHIFALTSVFSMVGLLPNASLAQAYNYTDELCWIDSKVYPRFQGPCWAKELSTHCSPKLYNGAWLCDTFNSPATSYEHMRKSSCDIVDPQCHTGQLASLPGTNRNDWTQMYDVQVWSPNCQIKPESTICTPYLSRPNYTKCLSKKYVSTCNGKGWCTLDQPPSKIDADGDGVAKCIVPGEPVMNYTPELDPLFGTGGCDCNQVPYDCNDFSKDITLPSARYDSRGLSHIVAIRPFVRMGEDASKKTFNPFQPLAIEVKAKSPCVQGFSSHVYLYLGYGNGTVSFDLGIVEFHERFDTNLHPEVKPAPGTLVGSLGGDIVGNPRPWGWFAHGGHQDFENFLLQIRTSPLVSARLVIGQAAKDIPIDLCVPIAGSGPHNIVLSRAVELKNIDLSWQRRPIESAQNVWDSVLKRYSPFRENVSQFSIYADLSPLSEREVKLRENGFSELSITGRLACGNSPLLLFESSINKRSYALPVQRSIIMQKRDSVSDDYYLQTVAHELGHAFANLRDEYDNFKWNPGKSPEYAWAASRNCAYDTDVPSAFPPPGNTLDLRRAICEFRGFYRSTEESMMNNEYIMPRFNVVSCAWIMSSIYGQPYRQYLRECEDKYDTVKQ